MDTTGFFIFSGILAFLSLLFGVIRLIKGPHILDRALSLDYLGFVGVSICGIAMIYFENDLLLDLALTFSLVCFVTALISSKVILKQKEVK